MSLICTIYLMFQLLFILAGFVVFCVFIYGLFLHVEEFDENIKDLKINLKGKISLMHLIFLIIFLPAIFVFLILALVLYVFRKLYDIKIF